MGYMEKNIIGISLIPYGEQIPNYGNPPEPVVTGATYRELVGNLVHAINKDQFDTDENELFLVRGNIKKEFRAVLDESDQIKKLQDELRNCRARMSELLDKSWEGYGQYVGEEEFEGYDHIKWAREQIQSIDKILAI